MEYVSIILQGKNLSAFYQVFWWRLNKDEIKLGIAVDQSVEHIYKYCTIDEDIIRYAAELGKDLYYLFTCCDDKINQMKDKEMIKKIIEDWKHLFTFYEYCYKAMDDIELMELAIKKWAELRTLYCKPIKALQSKELMDIATHDALNRLRECDEDDGVKYAEAYFTLLNLYDFHNEFMSQDLREQIKKEIEGRAHINF